MAGHLVRPAAMMANDLTAGRQMGLFPAPPLAALEPPGRRPARRIRLGLVVLSATAAIGGDEMLGFVLNKSAMRAAERRLARSGRHYSLCADRNRRNLAGEVVGD